MTVVSVGLDLSLASTGLAAMVDGRLARVGNIVTTGKKGDSYAQHMPRIIGITRDISTWLKIIENDYDLIGVAVIESPSYGSRFGNPHERAAIWWRVYYHLWLNGTDVVTVSPAGRAKYITGNGKAKKPEVLEHAQARYGELVENHDIADAAGMAAMGSRALGMPVEQEISDACLKSYEGVSWPSLTAT